MALLNRIIYFLSILIVGLIPLEAITIEEGVTYSRYVYVLLMGLSLLNFKVLIPPNKRYIRTLIFFVLFAFLSIIWSHFTDETFFRVLLLVQYLSIVIILDNSVKTRSQILYLLLAYITGCLYISSKTIFDFVQNGMQSTTNTLYRVEIVGNPNENSFMIVFSMILAIIILKNWKQNKLSQLLIYSYLFIATFAIFANGSRNGFLMLSLIPITYLINTLRNFSLKKIIGFLILLIIGIIFITKYIPEVTLLRFIGITDDLKSGNFAHREIIWQNTWEMIKSSEFNPLIGKGWGTFNYEYRQHNGHLAGAHNFYITTFYTLGIIGIILLFSYFADLFKQLLRINHNKLICLLLLIIPMISMMSTNWESRKWWFIIGIFVYKITWSIELEQNKN